MPSSAKLRASQVFRPARRQGQFRSTTFGGDFWRQLAASLTVVAVIERRRLRR